MQARPLVVWSEEGFAILGQETLVALFVVRRDGAAEGKRRRRRSGPKTRLSRGRIAGDGMDTRAAFLSDLAHALPSERIVTRPETLEGLRRDRTPIIEAGTPVAAVFPTSTDEVATVLRLASQHRVPIVPRGAGSGLAGGANAINGSVVLSLIHMDRILEINAEDWL